MTDFVVDDNSAYSFVKLESFDYLEMMETNSSVKNYCPAKVVMAFIHAQMLTQPLHSKLLVILKGNRADEFQHALCFIRRDFGKKKQLLMMDCKNTGPCVYPRIYYED